MNKINKINTMNNIKTKNNLKTNNNIKINFVLSSISFLQLYLPIINLANTINIESVFYLRQNIKKYACPVTNHSNSKILNNILKKYNIETKKSELIENLKSGILFVVDGDIYGPRENHQNDSVLFKYKISKDLNIISLCEHLNFLWVYNKFIDKVNYVVFPNEIYPLYYKMLNSKNIFLGNTKFDFDSDFNEIHTKFNIPQNNKYVLFLYPKDKYVKKYSLTHKDINNLFCLFRNCGYKIIAKTRPKDVTFNILKPDYNIISDTYPNESLELMKISDLCVFFSSSAIDECVMMEIPTLDFIVDTEIEKRLEFLYDDNIIRQIKNWKNINSIELQDNINKLVKKNDNIFKQIKEKYLYSHNNTSKNILDFIFPPK